jgi:hypothetical protein
VSAQWSRLTVYLLQQSTTTVTLSWSAFAEVVGSVPASAVDHYPQWWHGDRPNTRAWRAAGFELDRVRPGEWVRFRRIANTVVTVPDRAVMDQAVTDLASTDLAATAPVSLDSAPVRSSFQRSTSPVRPSVDLGVRQAGLGMLVAVDPRESLVIDPCSARKRRDGHAPAHTVDAMWPAPLLAARARLGAMVDVDKSQVLPAWQRYTGNFYSNAGRAIEEAAVAGRLLILSGGYGLLEAQEPIGNYDHEMRTSDWPTGLLENLIARRTETAGLNVVAFAARSSAYYKVLSRVRWRLPAGREALLVTIDSAGAGAMTEVPRRLGVALAVWWTAGITAYPAGVSVRRLT